jgi:hypothetical protein
LAHLPDQVATQYCPNLAPPLTGTAAHSWLLPLRSIAFPPQPLVHASTTWPTNSHTLHTRSSHLPATKLPSLVTSLARIPFISCVLSPAYSYYYLLPVAAQFTFLVTATLPPYCYSVPLLVVFIRPHLPAHPCPTCINSNDNYTLLPGLIASTATKIPTYYSRWPIQVNQPLCPFAHPLPGHLLTTCAFYSHPTHSFLLSKWSCIVATT